VLFDEMREIQHKHGYLPADQIQELAKNAANPALSD